MPAAALVAAAPSAHVQVVNAGTTHGSTVGHRHKPKHKPTKKPTHKPAKPKRAKRTTGMLDGGALPPGLTLMSGRHLSRLPCR